MTSLTPLTKEDIRIYAGDNLRCSLSVYAAKLIHSAEVRHPATTFDYPIAVAANGLRMLTRLPAKYTIMNELEERDGLEIVAEAFPQIVRRSERNWRELATTAWESARFAPDAVLPEDRSLFGHIELLAALEAGRAHLTTDPLRAL